MLARGGFDFWESGADYIRASDRFDCFVQHQEALLGIFSSMVSEYGFTVVDGNRPVREVYDALRDQIRPVVAGMGPAAEPRIAIDDEIVPPLTPADSGSRSVSAILADLLEALKDQ